MYEITVITSDGVVLLQRTYADSNSFETALREVQRSYPPIYEAGMFPNIREVKNMIFVRIGTTRLAVQR